jgi:hypothetical protein
MREGEREGYVHMTLSLQGREACGARGQTDKNLI